MLHINAAQHPTWGTHRVFKRFPGSAECRLKGESTLPPPAGNTSCQVADAEKERIISRKTNE